MMRDNEVHRIYDEIIDNLGELASAVSKSYIYEKIKERTKLSIRTISFILNHTRYQWKELIYTIRSVYFQK